MKHGSLAWMKSEGQQLEVSCLNTPARCIRRMVVNLDFLIDRVGPDFIFTRDAALKHLRFRCSNCGNRDVHFTVIPIGAYNSPQKQYDWTKK